MAQKRDIRAAIEAELNKLFAGVQIVSVDVTPDVDEDGDNVLQVEVVFHAEKKRLDARTASEIARRVRTAIDSADEERFPILSFIADSEMKKAKPAAA